MDLMEDLIEGAKEELKRADHSIYVTLKYTRTVDVIKNVIKRLINACDLAMIEALEHLKKQKKIKEIPPASKLRADLIASSFPKLKKEITFYFMLKDVDKALFKKKEEYRKNVALLVQFKGKELEINIDALKKYFDRTVQFVDVLHYMAS